MPNEFNLSKVLGQGISAFILTSFESTSLQSNKTHAKCTAINPHLRRRPKAPVYSSFWSSVWRNSPSSEDSPEWKTKPPESRKAQINLQISWCWKIEGRIAKGELMKWFNSQSLRGQIQEGGKVSLISGPSDFRHVTHMGPESGIQMMSTEPVAANRKTSFISGPSNFKHVYHYGPDDANPRWEPVLKPIFLTVVHLHQPVSAKYRTFSTDLPYEPNQKYE